MSHTQDANIPVALVTGAGQGIGRATALKFAAHGIHTILVGRTEAKLARVADEITNLGATATIHALDVTHSDEVARLQQHVSQDHNRLDILVNAAGMSFIALLEDTSETDWDNVFNNNLKGVFLMAKAFLPMLRQSENASIINIASKVALVGHGTVTAYTAAKAGLVGFTRALSDELRAEEIRVTAICPGATDTPMRWAATPDYDPKVVIDAETVAETVWHVTQLPRSVITNEIVVQSAYYD